MQEASRIEISKKALRHNIRFMKKLVGPSVTFSSVVKGNAYGHGIETFVPLAEKFGIRHFSVFSSDEAERALNSITKKSEIMVMGHIDDQDLEWAILNGISFYIFELGRLKAAALAARKTGKMARIHLQLETGMNRLGLPERNLEKVAAFLRNNSDCFVIEGICTHYAGAESIGNYYRIKNQISKFNELVELLKTEGITAKKRHTACSAAAINYPETTMDMVRIGIAHYGFWPTQETRMNYLINNVPEGKNHTRNILKPVISWKSRIMEIQDIGAGQFVGYGIFYQTNRRQKIAAVPVGYCHGFARSLSNLGRVLIRGRRAAVAGTVGMNMMMINVTDIPGVEKGDEVVIIGRQKRNRISVASFGDMTQNLNYEVLVKLAENIPRYVVE